MRLLLPLFIVLATVICEFQERVSRNTHYYVENGQMRNPRRIFRVHHPSNAIDLSDRVFYRAQRNTNKVLGNEDQTPLSRSSGRFYRKTNAAPTLDLSIAAQVKNDSVINGPSHYNQERHHKDKLVEDPKGMAEAVDYAKTMGRTTMAMKMYSDIDATTTPMPRTTTTKKSTTTRSPSNLPPQPPPVVPMAHQQQVAPAALQPQPQQITPPLPIQLQQQFGAALPPPPQQQQQQFPNQQQFSGQQTNGGFPQQQNIQSPQPFQQPQFLQQQGQNQFGTTAKPKWGIRFWRRRAGQTLAQQLPQQPAPPFAQSSLPPLGQPNFGNNQFQMGQFNQQPFGQNANIGGTQQGAAQLPNLGGIGQLPQPQTQLQLPQVQSQVQGIPQVQGVQGLGQSQIPQTALPNPLAPPPPQPPLPQMPNGGIPPGAFGELPEVINQQSANSSLEALGCAWDIVSNSCKDVFGLSWCNQCHDFGNIFLHDCKCVNPNYANIPKAAPRSQFVAQMQNKGML